MGTETVALSASPSFATRLALARLLTLPAASLALSLFTLSAFPSTFSAFSPSAFSLFGFASLHFTRTLASAGTFKFSVFTRSTTSSCHFL